MNSVAGNDIGWAWEWSYNSGSYGFRLEHA